MNSARPRTRASILLIIRELTLRRRSPHGASLNLRFASNLLTLV
jgi:hypothetical protein